MRSAELAVWKGLGSRGFLTLRFDFTYRAFRAFQQLAKYAGVLAAGLRAFAKAFRQSSVVAVR